MVEDCFDNKIARIAEKRKNELDDMDLREMVDTAVRKALDNVSDDLSFLESYGESISKRGEDISKLSETALAQKRSSLQSEFFLNNLILSSSISKIFEKFEEAVEESFRHSAFWMRDNLIGVQVKLLAKIQPILEKYLEKVKAFAKKIGVQNFSISVGTSLVSFSFTFGI
jgi:hypothetical protein